MNEEMQKSFQIGKPREAMVQPIRVYPITQSYAQELERISQPTEDETGVSRVFAPSQTTTETATPVNRAVALVIRMAPFSVTWFLLAFGVVAFLQINGAWIFILFAILTAVTFFALNGQEYRYGASGLEHHRIDVAERLASQKMAQDAAIKREIAQAYLKQLGGSDQ